MNSNYVIQPNSLTPEIFKGAEFVKKNRSKYNGRDCIVEKIFQEMEDTGACKMNAHSYQCYDHFWEGIAEDFVDKGYYAKLKYRRFKWNGAIQLSHIVVSKIPLYDNSNYYSLDRIILKKEFREAI